SRSASRTTTLRTPCCRATSAGRTRSKSSPEARVSARASSLATAALCLAAALAAAQQPAPKPNEMTTEANPLLAESTLPFHYPPPRSARIGVDHSPPAFERGRAEHRREIAAIAASKDAPSFENTIVAMEKAGQLLARTSRVFFGLNGSNTNPEMQKLQREMA